MKKTLDILRELLVDDLLDDIVHKNGVGSVRLREKGADAKLNRVDLLGIPENSVLIKLDAYDQPLSLFKGKKRERQRCDYILFTVLDGQGYALFIELKSAKLKKSEYISQFKGAECVVDYCHAALQRFHDYDGLKAFSKHFVVFYRPRLAKQRTRPKPATGNTSPENALRYPSPHSPSLSSLVT